MRAARRRSPARRSTRRRSSCRRSSGDRRPCSRNGSSPAWTSTPDALARSAERFGAQCMVIAIDARRRDGGWEVVVDGGRTATGIDAVAWAAEATQRHGAGEILLTSMDRDGTGDGYDLELLNAVAEATTVPLIASGGAGTVEHFAEGLRVADAVLAASRF